MQGTDRALIRIIRYRALIRNRFVSPVKIALVGEKHRRHDAGSLVYRMKHDLSLNYKDITVFTEKHSFKVEDGEHFDIIVGARPCKAEKLMLEAAAKFQKRIIVMPCACGGITEKVVKYIRDYPIITNMDSKPAMLGNGKPDSIAWMVLYNTYYSLEEFKKGGTKCTTSTTAT